MDDGKMDLFMWHGGKFVDEPVLCYVGGKKHRFTEIDKDLMSPFELKYLYEGIDGNINPVSFFYNAPGKQPSDGLMEIKCDSDMLTFLKAHEGLGVATVYAGSDQSGKVLASKTFLAIGDESNKASRDLQVEHGVISEEPMNIQNASGGLLGIVEEEIDREELIISGDKFCDFEYSGSTRGKGFTSMLNGWITLKG
ncbi:unnamed protein product [Cuscuta campestris]|uniref:PB1-like domain-containing protein n=1 Tax=Cuscuta campestris TaxID=132261 RepID=A0A484KKH0_9ASTE|nr:unnamed protein product [Cuscuta campestris]